jgi:2',3'-cyclic-nucleotide 2'-phosphodiesterase (5'-nucleotidase family)
MPDMERKRTKKFTNLIVLGILVIASAVFLIVKNDLVTQMLLAVGFYEDKISIANTADVHGHLMYDEETGGYYSLDEVGLIMGLPLVKHYVDDFRAQNPNTLFLDSGDMFHGTNEANIENGKGIVEAVNLMGYDATVPGNHDFNFGFPRLLEIRSQLNFPILSANIFKNGKLVFDEYRIVRVGDKKIGLFGLTVKEALWYTNSRDTAGITIGDPIPAAKAVVSKLRPQVDAVILISHLGIGVDLEVVKKVDGIDLVLCGHEHLLYKSALKLNQTYLAEAGSFTTHVGLANLYFRNHKVAKVDWHVYQTRDRTFANPKIEMVAQKYYKIARENLKENIGKTEVALNGIRWQVRCKETNLANLLADAMRAEGKADLALMNGGGIRESIPRGEISLYKIGKVLPFANSLITVEMKGERIYEAIERGTRQYPNGVSNGGFLQVSGISYVFDGSKPAGERLVSVSKDGKPLDKEKIYKVATNDYLFNGGDEYVEFKNARLISNGGLLKDVLTQYLKEKQVVNPIEDGRIKVINERYR